MKFTIITPNLNQGEFLSECIESLLAQSSSFEHIIVDGGSTDETNEVLARYQDRVRVERIESRTPSEAICHGLQFGSGDVIGWLPSDDYYAQDALASVEQFLTAHREVDVVYGGVYDVEGDGTRNKRQPGVGWSPRRLNHRCLITQPAWFYRRSVLEKHGAPDPTLNFWYDYDYWLRLAKHEVRFARLKLILGSHRRRTESLRHGCVSMTTCLHSAEEFCEIQRRNSGSVSVKAALTYGNRLMAVDRIDRDTDWAYDRGVLSSAYQIVKDDTRFAKTKLFFHHGASEFTELLKRPRYVIRFLPGMINRMARTHLRHRVFSDHYSRPRPVSIPESYYQPIELENPPKISMVTPNLNQGPFIEATLRSILDQEYPNLELIVQDGVSSDESLDVIERYESSLAHWDSSPDHGQAHAINKGMRHATGEIMAFLNSDDLLIPGSLGFVARYFQEHPEVDVVYGHRILVDENGDEISRWVLPPYDDDIISYADYIPQETMFWRRRAWEAVGEGLDDSFQFALDWDLILRFREAGMKFERLPRFLGAFRITETQKTSALIHTVGEREMRKLRNRIFGRSPSNREIRRRVKPYLRRQWLYDCCYKLGLANY